MSDSSSLIQELSLHPQQPVRPKDKTKQVKCLTRYRHTFNSLTAQMLTTLAKSVMADQDQHARTRTHAHIQTEFRWGEISSERKRAEAGSALFGTLCWPEKATQNTDLKTWLTHLLHVCCSCLSWPTFWRRTLCSCTSECLCSHCSPCAGTQVSSSPPSYPSSHTNYSTRLVVCC